MAGVRWAASLLILPALYSPAVMTPAPTRYLCGPELVDALYSVCGDRGIFFNPRRNRKRYRQPLLGFLSKGAEQDGLQRAPSGHEPRVKRGIVEECCYTPCSIYHLEGYCNWPTTPQREATHGL